MKLNGISTIFVLVENMGEAKKFYQDKLALGKPTRETPSWAEWRFGNKAATAFGIQKATDEELEGSIPARSTVKFHFQVDDVRKAYNELFEKGIRVSSEPREGNGFLYVEFLDTEGNVLRVVEYLK